MKKIFQHCIFTPKPLEVELADPKFFEKAIYLWVEVDGCWVNSWGQYTEGGPIQSLNFPWQKSMAGINTTLVKRNPRVFYDLRFWKSPEFLLSRKVLGVSCLSTLYLYAYIFTFIGMLPPPRMSVQSQSAGWASFVVTYSFNDHGTFSKIYHQRCTLIQMHLYRSISYGMESSYIWLCFPWLLICFHPNWERTLCSQWLVAIRCVWSYRDGLCQTGTFQTCFSVISGDKH